MKKEECRMKKADNMKTIPIKFSLAAAMLLSTLNPQLSTVFAQGSLTPPGAPAPAMKTLAQIEPRTPISSVPFTNSAPGSYYLTTNLTVSSGNAITISTNGVTLDLNGFTITSTAGSATGFGIVLNSGLRNIIILNGFIQGGVTLNAGVYSGPGFQYGIIYSGTAPVNTRISGVSVSGCLIDGIYLGVGDSTVVESCTVRTVGGTGIGASVVKGSVAVDCGGHAIYGNQVSDSQGGSSGSSDGVHALSTAQNCLGSSDSGFGLWAGTTALNCCGSSPNGAGLYAYAAQNCYGSCTIHVGLSSHVALNCFGSSSGDWGLSTYIAQNCYGSSSGTGLYAAMAQNCHGISLSAYPGLQAEIAFNCYGFSSFGIGLQFTKIGAMCWGDRGSPSSHNYVLGSGMAGPVNLP
jgi:hypothetical protein